MGAAVAGTNSGGAESRRPKPLVATAEALTTAYRAPLSVEVPAIPSDRVPHHATGRDPARPRYQLKRRWRYGGRSWRLGPGRYRWFVWPGFGPRSKADYGRRIGPGRFRVARP